MRKQKKKLAVRLGAAAGTVASGALGCDCGPIVCDPPPPPLCDTLDIDPALSFTVDRQSIALGETMTFTATADSAQVVNINMMNFSASAGEVTEVEFVSADTVRVRWTAQNPEGGFTVGQQTLSLQWTILLRSDRSCMESSEIVVDIDEEGTATVVSMPGASGLGSYFELRIDASAIEGGYRLVAVPTLPEEERARLEYRWRASSGRLEAAGATASFFPDLKAGAVVVQVEVYRGERGLAVTSWVLQD